MSLRANRLLCRSYLRLSITRNYKKQAVAENESDTSVSTASALPKQTQRESLEIFKNLEAIKANPALLPSQMEKKKFDELNYSIRTANNSNELFYIYLQNKNGYDVQQYLLSIERLAGLLKAGDFTSESLHQSVVFESLCYETWKITSQLESWMVLKLYTDLLNLKVSTNFLIMQSLLQMMRHQINLLSIKELIFLHTILSQTEDCNLKTALQLAIPKVIENCINVHFPVKLKFSEATQLLNICIFGEVKCFWRVLNHFYKEGLQELLTTEENPSYNMNLISLISNLCDLICNENILLVEKDLHITHKLLANCFKQLVENEIVGVPEELVVILSRKLSHSFRHSRGRFVYQQQFLNAVVHRAVVEEWNIKSCCKIIEYQIKMFYVSDELVRFVASSLTKNPNQISEINVNIPPLISALAASNLPNEQAEELTTLLMADYAYPTDNVAIPWIRFALDLLALNYVPHKLLEVFANKDFLSRYLSCRMNAHREINDLLLLEKVLKIEDFGVELNLPENIRSFEKDEPRVPQSALVLGSALQFVTGSPRPLLSKVVTPNANVIDHLLVLDKEGNPKPFLSEECDDEHVEFDSLLIPEESRKIAIMEIPDYWTHRPGAKLRGSYKMELKLIESEGFEVLPLHEREIDFSESAKVIVYIKHKLQLVGVNTN